MKLALLFYLKTLYNVFISADVRWFDVTFEQLVYMALLEEERHARVVLLSTGPSGWIDLSRKFWETEIEVDFSQLMAIDVRICL